MSIKKYAKEGIAKGFFWSIGVTLGFAFISVFAVVVLSKIVTIPVIGDFVAQVVDATNSSLQQRTTRGKIELPAPIPSPN